MTSMTKEDEKFDNLENKKKYGRGTARIRRITRLPNNASIVCPFLVTQILPVTSTVWIQLATHYLT